MCSIDPYIPGVCCQRIRRCTAIIGLGSRSVIAVNFNVINRIFGKSGGKTGGTSYPTSTASIAGGDRGVGSKGPLNTSEHLRARKQIVVRVNKPIPLKEIPGSISSRDPPGELHGKTCGEYFISAVIINAEFVHRGSGGGCDSEFRICSHIGLPRIFKIKTARAGSHANPGGSAWCGREKSCTGSSGCIASCIRSKIIGPRLSQPKRSQEQNTKNRAHNRKLKFHFFLLTIGFDGDKAASESIFPENSICVHEHLA